jgi:hypothetical protein
MLFGAVQAEENLGMAMMYTLATSAKEWLRERYNQNLDSIADGDSDVEAKDEVFFRCISNTKEVCSVPFFR